MAVSQSLNSALESASASVGSQSTEGGQGTGGGATQQGSQTQQSQTDTGQTQSTNTADFIGFTPEESATGTQGQQNQQGTQTQQNQQTQQSATVKLSDAIPADTVVMHDAAGKPITAQEARDGYLRQSDYSRKTAEIAQERKDNEPLMRWFQANQPYIQRLNSPDVAERTKVLHEIAQMYGVKLGSAEAGQTQAGATQAGKIGLLDPAEWGDESKPLVEHANGLVAQNQALQAKIDELDQKFGQFTNSLQSAQEQQQVQSQIGAIAQDWGSKGFKDVDSNAAAALVGKPMTVENAMYVANIQKLLAHTFALAKTKAGATVPNEPGSHQGSQQQARTGPRQLNEALSEAATNMGRR